MKLFICVEFHDYISRLCKHPCFVHSSREFGSPRRTTKSIKKVKRIQSQFRIGDRRILERWAQVTKTKRHRLKGNFILASWVWLWQKVFYFIFSAAEQEQKIPEYLPLCEHKRLHGDFVATYHLVAIEPREQFCGSCDVYKKYTYKK